MIQLIPYIFYALLSARGNPTGYHFIYTAKQNKHANIQKDKAGVVDEVNKGIYSYRKAPEVYNSPDKAFDHKDFIAT